MRPKSLSRSRAIKLNLPDSVVQATDYDALETLAKSVVKDKQKFERLEVSKEDLLKMFEVRLSRL